MVRGQIAKGAIISYLAIAANLIISLLYTPWMIQKIGVSNYGLYSLAGTFLSYFLFDFGLGNTITRFIAKYRAEGDISKISNLLGLVAKLYLILDTIILVVLSISYFFVSDIFKGLTPDEIEVFKVLYCIAGLFAILNFILSPVRGVLSAYEFFVIDKSLELASRIGTVLLIVVALLFDGNVYSIVFITGFVGFVISLTRYFVFLRKTKLHIAWNYYNKNELFGLASFSGWILVNQISQMLRISLVPTILGIVSCSTEISIFSIGQSLVGMVWTMASALNGLFLPKVSRMSQNNDIGEISALMTRVGRLQLYVMMLIISGFCVYGKLFMTLWVGETFIDSYWVFLLIIFSNLITHTLQIGMDYVYAQNKVKDTAMIMLVSSTVGMVLTLCFAHRFGAIGAAIGTGIALFLTQVLNVLYFHKRMNLNMILFFRNCHLKIMPLLVVFAVVFFFLDGLICSDTWMHLIIGAFIFLLIYLLLCYLFIMNDDERGLIKSLIPIKSK